MKEREVSRLKKIDTTKIVVKATEWVSNMAILNLTWLLFSLPIITIIPATDALFNVIHDWEAETPSEPIFHLFTQSFKKNFKHSYKFGLPMFLIAAIFVLDIVFLSMQTIPDAWFQLFKYALYTLSILFLLGALFSYPLSKRIQTTPLRTFLSGLMLAIGHPIISLGLLLSLIIILFILLRWPALLFFFSVSGIAWLSTKAVTQATKKQKKNARSEDSDF